MVLNRRSVHLEIPLFSPIFVGNFCSFRGDTMTNDIDAQQIRDFFEIINYYKGNLKFQVFLKNGKPSRQYDIETDDRLIALCKEYNLRGISCTSVNPRRKGKSKTSSVVAIAHILFDIDVKA